MKLNDDRAGRLILGLRQQGVMDPRVLSPEENTRAAITLSALQVRKPINHSSIGRWKNYEWAFDSSWDALVDEHATKLA